MVRRWLAPLCCLLAFPDWLCFGLPCAPLLTPDASRNLVCVCNATYCDSIDTFSLTQDSFVLFESTEGGKRFHKSEFPQSDNQSDATGSTIRVAFDRRNTLQTVAGFGGAFTDSVGLNLRRLNEASRKKLLYSYFNPIGGIGYTFARVPIASTDFSTRIYSYDDVPDDFELKHFALAPEDHDLKIPFMQMANLMTENTVKFLATPWSAPHWMKKTGNMSGGGPMRGPVEGKYFQSWARYFLKFLKTYAEKGIKFWGLTIQNEPTGGKFVSYPWQAMDVDAKTQAAFVRLHLNPTLANSAYGSKLKVLAHDDNRPGLLSAAQDVMSDEGHKHIDGYAVHWYWDDLGLLNRLNATHNLDPSKFLLYTEACNGYRWPGRGVQLGSWARGERYAKSIMDSLNNWSVGWIDWNLCLDETGGPTWARNFVDSPIIVTDNNTFYKQPMFYALGHFSRFISPGSVRLQSWTDGTQLSTLDFVVFLTPLNHTVMVIQNRANSACSLNVEDVLRQKSHLVTVEPRSVSTLLWL